MNSNNSLIRIVIADSQFLVVEALKALLGNDERFLIAGVVNTKCELGKVLSEEPCDLLITDIALVDYDSPDDLQKIKSNYPGTSILILTNYVSKAEFTELAKIGIKHIICKTADRDEIFSAIEATMKDKKYYSDEILDMIIEMGGKKPAVDDTVHLTDSEIEIVRLIAGGLTTKEIASRKNISFHTVNTHRKNIFRKMDVSNASELIIQSIKAGWIDNIEYFI
jgi:DNA-binding NarL/FixJ family response regulator